jgi:L-asparaginase
MKNILLVHTGGTLGMSGRRPDALKPGSFFRTVRERVPELTKLAHLEFEVFSNIDSCEMQPELWSQLAQRLAQRLPHFDGVVVTHGTDTLAETACALSFMLPGLRKPVVLTGAQRPLGEVRTDARLNLIDAFTAAVQGPREVVLCFDSKLFRGNRSTKVKVDEYDAFESPNHPPLGSLGVHARFAPGLVPRGKPQLRERMEPRVFLLKLFPGMAPEVPLGLLSQVKGLVVEAFGSGNFPLESSQRSLLPLFDRARESGIPVVLTSQAHRNGVDLDMYASGARARALGALSGGDMTAEACVVKLMHALAYEKTHAGVRARFERAVAGERAERR